MEQEIDARGEEGQSAEGNQLPSASHSAQPSDCQSLTETGSAARSAPVEVAAVPSVANSRGSTYAVREHVLAGSAGGRDRSGRGR